jgi:hypothetical protein
VPGNADTVLDMCGEAAIASPAIQPSLSASMSARAVLTIGSTVREMQEGS